MFVRFQNCVCSFVLLHCACVPSPPCVFVRFVTLCVRPVPTLCVCSFCYIVHASRPHPVFRFEGSIRVAKIGAQRQSKASF